MKMTSKFKSIFLVSISVAFLVLFLGVARFVLVEDVHSHEKYIPDKSQYAIQIQGKEIFKTSIHDLFLEYPDREIFNLLQKLIIEGTTSQKIKDIGINVLSDVFIFNYSTAGGEFFGFIFQLTNSNSFQKNLLDQVSKNTGGACNSETGILLMFKPAFEKTVLSKSEIEKEALQILNNPQQGKYFTENQLSDNSFLLLEKTSSDPTSFFGTGNVSLHSQDSILKIKGSFSTNKKIPKSNWSLRPHGFHLSSSLLTSEIKDSIQKQLQKQGFDLPKPAKIAFNYAGIQMGNGGIIPKVELLLEFDTVVPKNKLIEPKSWRKLGFTLSEKSAQEYVLSNGSTEFLLIILDAKTIFIGPNKTNLSQQQNNRLFHLTGDARYLTKIEGGGLIAMSLNLYPPFRISKDFVESLKTSDVEIYTKNGKSIVRGEISFREKKSVTVETMRLFLKLNEL